MKEARKTLVVAVVLAIAVVGAASAQDAVLEPERRWCTPAGTWIGQNETFGLEYVVTVEPMGGGRFSVVGEGIDETPPWTVSTAWRGMQYRTGHRTYSLTQTKLAGPSQFTDPAEGVPDIFGIQAVVTMLDCDHIEIEFGPAEFYAWGQIPFEDEPVATGTPSISTYTRVPFEQAFAAQSE